MGNNLTAELPGPRLTALTWHHESRHLHTGTGARNRHDHLGHRDTRASGAFNNIATIAITTTPAPRPTDRLLLRRILRRDVALTRISPRRQPPLSTRSASCRKRMRRCLRSRGELRDNRNSDVRRSHDDEHARLQRHDERHDHGRQRVSCECDVGHDHARVRPEHAQLGQPRRRLRRRCHPAEAPAVVADVPVEGTTYSAGVTLGDSDRRLRGHWHQFRRYWSD